MSKGVVAVLGPSASPASNSIISNICGEKEVSLCTQLACSLWPRVIGSSHYHQKYRVWNNDAR